MADDITQVKYPYYPVCKVTDSEIIQLNAEHWECVDRVRELDRVYVAVAFTCLSQCLHAKLIEPKDASALLHNIKIDFDARVIHAGKPLSFDQLHPTVVIYLEQYKDSLDEFEKAQVKFRDIKDRLRNMMIKKQYFMDRLFLDRNNTLMFNLEKGLADYQTHFKAMAETHEKK